MPASQAMASLPPIRFLFDYISPYACVAWHALPAIAHRHGREIHPEPILFAALLDAHGQRGPAEIPAKRRYVFRDALRKAHALGLTLTPPPRHPFNPLTALRATRLLQGPDRTRAITACFAATWTAGPGIDDPTTLATILTAAHLDGPALVAATTAQAAKDDLRDATTQAITDGVFGVPTMIVDGELFWGCDSLPHLDAFLAGRDPVPPDLDARWQHLPTGAVRPGSTGR